MPRVSVSVIIPTCRRPRLVQRAVESALRQTLRDIEVIVVPADADEETQIALARIADDRLHLLPFTGKLDPAAARNRGVQSAMGAWVAFLDDDDEWLEDKLQRQSQLARRSKHRRPIVSCGSFVRDGRRERQWPRRLPRSGEAIGDYLFRRESLLGAAGYLGVSTLLVPRELALEVPFRDFRPGEDLDWVLRAVRCDGVGVEFVRNADGDRPAPLNIWNIDAGRPHESLRHQWQNSVSWIRDNRALVSPEAYASFLLTWVSLEAARQRAGLRDFTELWREAVRFGKPSALDLAVHLAHWAIPSSAIRRLSGWMTGRPLMRTTVRVLAYHAITDLVDAESLKPYRIPEATFRRQIATLRYLGFHFITPEEFAQFLSGRATLPRKAVLLTFDDCYCDLLDVAPFFQAEGIAAIAFAVSGQLGGTNKWDEVPGAPRLRLLDALDLQTLQSMGIEIGAHSRTHRSLRGLDADELSAEISGSMSDLEATGLRRPRFFSPPYGQYDAEAQLSVRGSGAIAAFTTAAGIVSSNTDPMCVPRIEILRSDVGLKFVFKVLFARHRAFISKFMAAT